MNYLVVWEATDACGKLATRKDTIKVFRPGVAQIIKTQNIMIIGA